MAQIIKVPPPKLDLNTAVLTRINKSNIFQTDSTLVLQYLRNETCHIKTYIVKRVTERADDGSHHNVTMFPVIVTQLIALAEV